MRIRVIAAALLVASLAHADSVSRWLLIASKSQTSAYTRATGFWRPGRRFDSLDQYGRYHGTNAGAVTISTNGWLFHGNGDYVDFGAGTGLEPGTNAYAISAWAMNTNPTLTTRGIAGKLLFAGADRWGMYGSVSTNNFSGQLYDLQTDPGSTGTVAIATGRPIGTNQWHHYVQIFIPGVSHQLYYDGALVATGMPPAGYNLNATGGVTAAFVIGAFTDAAGTGKTNNWQGHINTVAMWKGATIIPSAAEVSNLFVIGANPQ